MRDESLKKILSVRIEVRRVLYFPLENVLVYLHWRSTVPEGRETAKHFEY